MRTSRVLNDLQHPFFGGGTRAGCQCGGLQDDHAALVAGRLSAFQVEGFRHFRFVAVVAATAAGLVDRIQAKHPAFFWGVEEDGDVGG